MLDFQKTGMEYFAQPVNNIMDSWVYYFLVWYYTPMILFTTYGSDVDRVISQLSLNGIKPFSLCQANRF